VIRQPVSVVSQCSLNAWVSSWLAGDQRRLTGSGSALEALRDDALYKSTYFTFLSASLYVSKRGAYYGRPLSVSGRPCYILPMFLFIYLFFYGRLILRPWLTEVRENFTRGRP